MVHLMAPPGRGRLMGEVRQKPLMNTICYCRATILMTTPDEIQSAVTAGDDGALLTIEVSAGCKVESFPSGFNTWRKAVGIQVKAPAVEGKANKAIIALIAGEIKVSRSSVQIVSGQTSSIKRVLIRGMDTNTLVSSLFVLFNRL